MSASSRLIPSRSQSPENGSQHCKLAFTPPPGKMMFSAESQSPENGSQHCKVGKTYLIRCLAGSAGRNPLKTGLSTASKRERDEGSTMQREGGRNPLKTGLSTASRPASFFWGARGIPCRNPLKTGLSTASLTFAARWAENIRESQSPENGSQHCKGYVFPTRL